jgi:tRNA(fMet)-specific endonuclease VapC
MILLDTDICIDIIRCRDASLLEQIATTEDASIALSVVTLAELEFGAANNSDPERNHLAVTLFASAFEVLPFDSRHARTYGDIRTYLSRKGMMIGPHDLQIASQALCHGATLMTRNTREFSRIPGLVISSPS